jgi:surface antigen
MSTNDGLSVSELSTNLLSLNSSLSSPLDGDSAIKLRPTLSSFSIATSGTFTDNGSSNFAGDLSNPFDDAPIYAGGGPTINGLPTFSAFGSPIAVGPGAIVADAVRQRWKVENLAQPVAIAVPAYVEPPIGAFDRTFEVGQLPLNGAADVARAFGDGQLPSVVHFTGGSLALPSDTVLRNLTIVVEQGDLNFNGDGHLLENVTLIVKDGRVNFGDVRAVNTAVFASDGIALNQGARFSGKNLLVTQHGDVVFDGATATIDSKDFVKVLAHHGNIFLNAAADVRGEFWSSEDFFANQASTIVGKIRAEHNITFNAQVRVISDISRNFDFPVKNQPAIAIIDTGFAGNNPDIDYSRITPLWDWVGGDDNPFLAAGEGNEHGTHTLGLIAATSDNNLGIDGVNGKAPIYLSRAVGSGLWSRAVVEFLDRFQADAKQPNPIIYLGFDLNQQNADGKLQTRYELTLEERSVLEYARQKGALIVVPAGNDGGVMSALGQAAQEFDNIVTVGAVDGNGRAAYSSYGAGLTIMTPGGTTDAPILSTVGDGLGTMAGTSEAAAYAAGYIGNIWAANPQLSYQQVIDIIKATARDINQAGWDAETGFGILDVVAAVELAQQTEPEVYDPPATILPLTLTGGDQLLSLERAANFSTDFTAWVVPTLGANVREQPTTKSRIVGTRAFKSNVKFTSWTYGERITDVASGEPDERWYYDAQLKGWIASAIVGGNAPGSTPLRPIDIIKSPGTNAAIDLNAPVYQNGRDNPFAYNWVGQCTWYAYGRMIETGLLPTSAKPNGLFLGNAEAWRRDAQRAGLTINSQPTQARGLVVWPPGVQGGDKRFGHVAFLEELLPDGRIRVSESNWERPLTFDQRFLTPAQYAGLAFIPLEGVTANPGVYSPPGTPGETKEYRVKKGDTLTAIALLELGNADRWRELKKTDGSLFTETEAKSLQIGTSVYLPVIKSVPPSSSTGNNSTNTSSQTPSTTPNITSSSQTFAPGKIVSSINFGLQNQDIWGKGQSVGSGIKFSDESNNTLNVGPLSIDLEAKYDFEAFISSGSFNLNIPVSFDINWEPKGNQNVLPVYLTPNLGADIKLDTFLGTSFVLSAGISSTLKGEVEFPFGGFSVSRELFDASGSFDSSELLSKKLEELGVPLTLDLGLASSVSGKESSIKAEDTASEGIDIVGVFSLFPLTKAPAEAAKKLGLEASLLAKIKQETFVDISGFEIDFDGKKNGNETIVEFNKSGRIDIPLLNQGDDFTFTLTAKPIVSLFTQFSVAGRLDLSFDPNEIDLIKQIRQESPKFSAFLETPYTLPLKSSTFNPFDFTRAIQLSKITIKA